MKIELEYIGKQNGMERYWTKDHKTFVIYTKYADEEVLSISGEKDKDKEILKLVWSDYEIDHFVLSCGDKKQRMYVRRIK